MPISTVDVAKELTATYQPLLLATFTFPDGTVLRLSTHPLSTAQGGAQYGGNDYLCRVQEQAIAQVQSLSETGADLTPSVRLTLADPDSYLYTNYELAHGFKDARLELKLIFCDVSNWTFTSDSRVPFVGTCEKPGRDALSLTIAAAARTGLTKSMLPIVPIQPRCPWLNPDTTAKRTEASDTDSPYYECGETRDLTTAPPCAYTKATCTQLTRYGGITYTPPSGQRVREYTSGQWADVQSHPNEAKYGDHFPMVYGTAWVEPPVMSAIPDGNYVRGECVVCVGEVGGIYRVTVNGVELSAANQQNGTPYSYVNKDYRYNWINAGDRDGSVNADVPWNSTGDPYGSLAAIMFLLPRSVAGDGIPRVRVLVKGPKIRVYTDASTFTRIFSENAAWVLLDLLTWCGYTYAECDLASFVAAAAKIAARPCALVLRQRRSAQEIIRGLRQAFGLLLYPDHSTGKLKLAVKSTLAEEQPSAITGSNYLTAIASKLPDGTAQNGYVPYRFDSASILKRDLPISLRELPTAAQDAPTKIGLPFQDRTADYAGSSLALSDADALSRSDGREIGGSLAVQPEGLTSLADAMRAGRVGLAELLRGNEVGDARGTRRYEFETSFRALDLRVGHLILLTDALLGLTNQLVRVLRIQPTTNYETMTLLVQWHDDDWYTDAYASTGLPAVVDRRRDRLPRPAFPWMPNSDNALASDSLLDPTEATFGLTQDYTTAADGARQAKLTVTGVKPINSFSSTPPPAVPLQGTSASTGGTIPGDRVLYMAICSKDSGGKYSALSPTIRIDIASGTATNTTTTSGLTWPSGATGHAVFAGLDSNRMGFQSEAATTPSSVTLTALVAAAWGAPDSEFDSLVVSAKRVHSAGVLIATVSSKTASTITVTGAGWTTNEWANRDLTILTGGSGVPVYNGLIASNTSDTLTITGPSLTTAGVVGGDVFVIRAKPTVSSTQLTDSKWSLADVTGKLARIIGGKGRGVLARIKASTSTSITLDTDATFDATTRPMIEDPDVIYSSITGSLENADPASPLAVDLIVGNLLGEILVVEAIARDGGGNESTLNPVREIYLTGESGGLAVGAANAPTGLTATINSYGENFTFACAWTPPSPMGGTSAYEFEYEVYSNSGGTTIVQPYSSLMLVTGGSTAVKESGEITMPTTDRWGRTRNRGVNAINESSSWAYSPVYALPKRTSATAVAPVKPSTASVTITSVGSRQYRVNPAWTLPGDIGGNVSYVREYSWDAGTTWQAPSETFGSNATSGYDGPWDRPESAATLHMRTAGKNADGAISAWEVSASGVSVTSYSDATPAIPTQPASGDWSIGSITLAGDYQTGQQVAQIPVTVTTWPSDCDYVQIWEYEGSGRPANPDLWTVTDVTILKASGAKVVTFYRTAREASWALQLCITASTDIITAFPDGATPYKTATIPAVTAAPAPTAFTVAKSSQLRSGVYYGRFEFSLTCPASPNIAGLTIQRKLSAESDADYKKVSGFQTLPDPADIQAGGTFAWNQGAWDWPWPDSADEVWHFKGYTEDHRGNLTAYGAVQTVTVTAGGGFQVVALSGKLGPNIVIRTNGKLDSASSVGFLSNHDFEQELAGWNTYGTAVTADSTTKYSGTFSAKLTLTAYAIISQERALSAGSVLKLIPRYKTNAQATGCTIVVAAYNSAGTILGYSSLALAAATDWAVGDPIILTMPATTALCEVKAQGGPVAGGVMWIDMMVATIEPGLTGAMTRDASGNVDIAAGGVTNAKLAALSVDAAKLADGAVSGSKVVDGAISDLKIAAGAVSETKLADLAVSAAKLAGSSVTATKIANAAVGSAAIAALAVGEAHINTAAVTEAKIGALAVGTAAIQNGAIVNAKIADATIQSAKIASLSVDKLTAGTATFSGDVVFARSGGGGSVTLNSGGVAIVGGAITFPTGSVTIDSGGIRVQPPGGSSARVNSFVAADTALTYYYTTANRYLRIGIASSGVGFIECVEDGSYIDFGGNASYMTANKWRHQEWTSATLAFADLTSNYKIPHYNSAGTFLGWSLLIA